MGWPARRSRAARGSSRRKIQNRKRPARIQVEQNPRGRKAGRILQNPAAQNPRVESRELAIGVVRVFFRCATLHCRNSKGENQRLQIPRAPSTERARVEAETLLLNSANRSKR